MIPMRLAIIIYYYYYASNEFNIILTVTLLFVICKPKQLEPTEYNIMTDIDGYTKSIFERRNEAFII